MDAGRVDEHDLCAIQVENALYGSACRLRLLGNDRELAPHQRVQQRRLPRVRAAQDGNKPGPESGRGGTHGRLWDNAAGSTLETRTCSTFSSSPARTSIRIPSRSTVSPTRGTCPSHSVTRPAMVVDSVSSAGRKPSKSC